MRSHLGKGMAASAYILLRIKTNSFVYTMAIKESKYHSVYLQRCRFKLESHYDSFKIHRWSRGNQRKTTQNAFQGVRTNWENCNFSKEKSFQSDSTIFFGFLKNFNAWSKSLDKAGKQRLRVTKEKKSSACAIALWSIMQRMECNVLVLFLIIIKPK